MSALSVFWFCLAPVLLTLYCATDGFDLGVATIYGFIRNPEDKKTALYSIWPVWNGNEVWLIGSIGVLIAAFPPVYGTLLSAMYVPVYLTLFSIILRGVSIEYFPKVKSPGLRKFLAALFTAGSAFILFAIGFVGSNVLNGLPVDSLGIMQKGFLSLFHPFSITAGIASIIFFSDYGALYLLVKTPGWGYMKKVFNMSWIFSFTLLLLSFLCGMFLIPGASSIMKAKPVIPAVLIISALFYITAYLSARRSSYGLSFIFYSLTIAGIISSCAGVMFPNLLLSSLSRDFSMTVLNSSSSDKSLLTSLIILLAGLPFIAWFIIWIYRVFRKI